MTTRKRPAPKAPPGLAHDLRNGLATVRNAVRLMAESGDPAIARESRGVIEIEISAMLEAIDRHFGASRARKRPGAPPANARERRRVLIVDDDRASAALLERLLASRGDDVRVVHLGGEALRAACAFAPDAILLDIALADADGYEVARELRAERALDEALIIATTGHAREGDLRRARRAGIDAHVAKPLDLDALLALIAGGRDGVR